MSVRRGATRLARLGVLLGALLMVVAAPAAADENKVKIRVPKNFSAGGSADSVTLNVTKRTDGCVTAQITLGVRLAGLTPDQVRVQVNTGGDWRVLNVASGGADLVIAEPVTPDKPQLCKKKKADLRYRLAFLAETPSGQAQVVAEAYSAEGEVLGHASGTTRVTGGRAVPLPSTRSATPSPTPTPQATEEIEAPATEEGPGAVASPVTKSDDGAGGGFGIGTVVMLLGVVMVGIGAALLVLLLRRGRADQAEHVDRAAPAAGPYPAGVYSTRPIGADPAGPIGADQTMLLPRTPQQRP